MASGVYDLNGDDQQDIIGSSVVENKLSLMKNRGAGSAIAFALPYTMDMPGGATEPGDLDGDSKPEICILYAYSNQLRILRNRIGEALPPKPVINSFTPTTSAYANKVIIKGGNLDQTTSVNFGGVPALYFTILSNDSIIATVGNGSSGAVSATTPGGTDSLDGFTYIPMPVITSFAPKGGKRGAAITIVGNNFTNATEVSFGGVAAGSFMVQSPDTIVAYLGEGATGSIRVHTPGGIARLDTLLYYLPPVINSITPASATTGRQVVLTGDHFEGVSTVHFGGVAASSFTISPDFKTIVAIVAAGATGSVTVVNPAGTFTLPGFTFVHPYSPAISYFTPPGAGAGATVTIKGNYFTGATAVSFGGVAARSFTIADSATIYAIVGAGATGDVSVTTPYGTATQNGFTYDNVTAIVDPANVNSGELTVSPNPANDLLIIKHPASVKNARLRFISILGHEVKAIIPARNATQTETSVLGLMAGVYTIIWTEGTRNLSRVFVVQ